jgi:hypothetical protein
VCREKRVPPGYTHTTEVVEKIITKTVSWKMRGRFRRLLERLRLSSTDILFDISIKETWHVFSSDFKITAKGTKSQIPLVESLVNNLLVV